MQSPLSGAIPQGPAGTEAVRVDLGERGYDILIGPGLIDEAGAILAQHHPDRRVMVVSDEQVADRHLGALEHSLAAAGVGTETLVLAPGEAAKSFATLERVVAAILDARLERNDVVIALGGGVVGDLAGFAAAIARRGMPFVQVPTTLLAQVDSSVGGKTGINAPQGKNLVGAFHQPSLVIADTGTLETLPDRELRAGYAEVVKYALIDDPDFFDWLERRSDDILSLGTALPVTIARCCEAKARVVADDEREAGRRALLNLGHTFGHGIEATAGYGGQVVHGEAVAIGMAMAFRYSVRLGLCPLSDAEKAIAHLARTGLPTRIGDVAGPAPGRDAILAAMMQDKKTVRGALRLVLVRGIGGAFVHDAVDTADVVTFLEEELSS